MEELHAEALQSDPRSKANSSQQQISVNIVPEFVRWNEDAISRCILLSSDVCICSDDYLFLFQSSQLYL